MPYPQDQETFRRVINQDLSEGEQGNLCDQDDHNLPVGLLEKLQNLIGYSTPTPVNPVYNRLTTIEAALGAIKGIEIEHKIVNQNGSASGTSELNFNFTLTNATVGLRYLFLCQYAYKSATAGTNQIFSVLRRFNTQLTDGVNLEVSTQTYYRLGSLMIMTTPPIESSYGYRFVLNGTGEGVIVQGMNIFVVKFYP